MRVLFVSDSLGSPIEQRGIHNFSVSLMENFRAEGAEVALLVERPATRWRAGRLRSKFVEVGQARKSVALADVMRYFADRRYSLEPVHRWAQTRFAPGPIKQLGAWAWIALVRLWAGGAVTVENDPAAVDFVPTNAAHLALPHAFVAAPAVYSGMLLRAACGLPPAVLNASGYDLVVVDTPSAFQVTGVAPERVLAVVHDMIPLRDPTMSAHWRDLFFRKLEATMAMKPSFVFVSRYSREVFHQTFPRYAPARSFVYYPTLRRSLLRRAALASKTRTRRFAPAEVARLEASVGLNDGHEAAGEGAARLRDAYVQSGWNAQLPYFVTIVSDEPRKNIGLIVKAFDALKGRANVVVMGNVDAARYLGKDAEARGHIRFTGFVSENDKMRIVAMSDGLIFPSFTEGFGIPLIEGALYDKPVLCSDIEVFREVAGDDATYFNPYSEDALAGAVERVIAGPLEAHDRALRLKARVLEHFTVEAATRRLRDILAGLGLARDGY